MSQKTTNDTFAPVDLQDYLGIAEQKPALRFLVIGGYAVAAHGHSRATFAVEFLASNEDREEWRQRLVNHRFRLISQTSGLRAILSA